MKKKKKFRLWTLVLIATICYFLYTMYNQQIFLDERKNQTDELNKNIRNEEIKNQQLQQQKDLINTDEFAEKIARERLGYVKDGEKIYIDTNK